MFVRAALAAIDNNSNLERLQVIFVSFIPAWSHKIIFIGQVQKWYPPVWPGEQQGWDQMVTTSSFNN